MNREEWLKERATYIGASEVAAVLGVSPYDSPHDIWLSKVKGATKDETIAMRRGQHMEPFIIAEFTRETGIETTPGQFHRHPKWPFMACNTDAEFTYNGYDAVLEAKDCGFFAGLQFGSDGADCVAEHYLVQIAYQMMVTGKKLGCLCVFLDGRELRKFWYTFDESLFNLQLPGSRNAQGELSLHQPTVLSRDMAKSVVKRVCDFWDLHVVHGTEPELTGTDSDTRYVQRERATYDNGQLTNTDEVADRECVLLARATQRLKRAEAIADARKNRIKHFMVQRGASALESSVGFFKYETNVRGIASLRTPFRSNNV